MRWGRGKETERVKVKSYKKGMGEGFVLWNTQNFPKAVLSFTSWTLASVLRFKEVHQYLEPELRIRAAWIRM